MKMNCSTAQFLVQIVVSPMDTGTSCHSICFLTDCLCKISFSKNHTPCLQKYHHWRYTDCISRPSASQHTKNREGNQCHLLARRCNHQSKYHSKCSIIKNYQAKLLSNAGMLGKGRKLMLQVTELKSLFGVKLTKCNIMFWMPGEESTAKDSTFTWKFKQARIHL